MAENTTASINPDLVQSNEKGWAEYFKVVDILQMYDGHFLNIKKWGVTVSAAIIGVAASQGSPTTYVLAAAVSLSFWATEGWFKLLQLGHTLRGQELEGLLSGDSRRKTLSPSILRSFGMQRALDLKTKRWRKVVFWPQVMLPHAVLTGCAIALGVAALVAR